jgi:hypothetical protein
MRRKSFVLAVLLGICIFSLANRPPSAMALNFPLCNSGYCPTHLDDACTCPGGTIRAGQAAPCDTWRPDCNEE